MSTNLEITPGTAKYGRIVAIKRTGEDAEGVPFPLCKLTCVIGRSEEADIRLQLASVSLQHCILNVDPESEQVSLETFATIIPSYLNESPLERNSKVPLKHGDLISVANRRFRFEYLPPNFTPKQVSAIPQTPHETSKAVEPAPETPKTLPSAPHSQTREIIVKIFTPLAKPPLSGILRRRSSITPAIVSQQKPETSPQLASEHKDIDATVLDIPNSPQTLISDPEQPISIDSPDVVTSDVTVEVQATPPEAEEGADSRIKRAGEDPMLFQSTPAGKRVSFGPYLSPEQYDSQLPPVTPVKKGAMPSRASLARYKIVSTTTTLVEEEMEGDEDLDKSTEYLENGIELQIEEQEVETDKSTEVIELASPDLFDSSQNDDELSPEKSPMSDDKHPDSLGEEVEDPQEDISALNESSSDPAPELSYNPSPEAPDANTTSTLLFSPKLKPPVLQKLSTPSLDLKTNLKDEPALDQTVDEPPALSEPILETLEAQLEGPERVISPENVRSETENVSTSEIHQVLTVEDEDKPILPKSASKDDAPVIQDVVSSSTPEVTEVSVKLEDDSDVSDPENSQSLNGTDKQTSVVPESVTAVQNPTEEPLEDDSDSSPEVVQLILEPESEEEPETGLEIDEEPETEVETEIVVEKSMEEVKTEERPSEASLKSPLSSDGDVTPPAEALISRKKSNRREEASKSASPSLEGVAELFNTPLGAKTMKGRRLALEEEPSESPFRRSRRILVQSTAKQPVVTIRRLTDEQVSAIQTELKKPDRGLAKQRVAKGLTLAVLEVSMERTRRAKKVEVEREEEVQPKRSGRGRPRNFSETSVEPEPPKKSKGNKIVPVVEFPQDVTEIEETPTKNLPSSPKSTPKTRKAVKGDGKGTKTTPSVVVVSPKAGRSTRGRGAAAKKVAVPVEEHEEEEEEEEEVKNVSVGRSSPRKAQGSSKNAVQEAPPKKVVPKGRKAVAKKEEEESPEEEEEWRPSGTSKRGTTTLEEVVVAPKGGKRVAKKITKGKEEDGASPPKRESSRNLPKGPQVTPVEPQTGTLPKQGKSTRPKGNAKPGKEEAEMEKEKKVAVTPKAKRGRPTRKSKEEESGEEEVEEVKKVAVKAKRGRPARNTIEEEKEDEEEVEEPVAKKAAKGKATRAAKKNGKTASEANVEWTAADEVEMARQHKGHAAHLHEEKLKSCEDSAASPRRNLRRKVQFDPPIEATPPSKKVRLARK